MNEALEHFIAAARWFGGKGRDLRVTGVRRLPISGSADDLPAVCLEMVTLAYGDDGAEETYQLPVVYYRETHDEIEHARIGEWDDPDFGRVHAYDALHDHLTTGRLLEAFQAEQTAGEVAFHRLPGHDFDLTARSALLSAEQSNSSVAFGDDCLLKVFRKVQAGRNPDIEIHEALTRAGTEHVAELYGWIQTTDESGRPVDLAMLQQFLRTASDGWDLALASVRGLLAELDRGPSEAGGDFGAEASRLGVATAQVHEVLRDSFGAHTWGPDELGALADAMASRLDAAVKVVPQLAGYASSLRAAFDAVRKLDEPVEVQRVHGDLHLGQTLRTVKGWKLVDFEGEPAKSLDERIRPDSPWRDVAGMLRSFDYAAHVVEADIEPPADSDEVVTSRADEWAARNRTKFLDGYTSVAGSAHAALLRAYEADKAVYEVVYEARNRPTWIGIPMRAIRRLSVTVPPARSDEPPRSTTPTSTTGGGPAS